jgi:GNAT superfamily N-acetyltransferase
MDKVTVTDTATATIREYHPSDSSEVLRLLAMYDTMIRDMLPPDDYRLEALRPNGVELWLDDLLKGDPVIIVAAVEDGLAGIVFGKVEKEMRMTGQKWGRLGSIYVDERYRHNGIARSMFDEIRQTFIDKGCTAMCVETWLANVSGIEAYRRLGFRSLTMGFATELQTF